MEVTAFERNRTYTITHQKAGARIDAVFTFEPVDDRTRVQIEFVLESHGLPPGTMAPVRWAIANKVRDVIGHDFEGLKAFIEQRTACQQCRVAPCYRSEWRHRCGTLLQAEGVTVVPRASDSALLLWMQGPNMHCTRRPAATVTGRW